MRDNIPSNFADTPYCHLATNLCHHFLISVFQLLPFLVSLFDTTIDSNNYSNSVNAYDWSNLSKEKVLATCDLLYCSVPVCNLYCYSSGYNVPP